MSTSDNKFEDLIKFMKKRNIAEDIINFMRDENIDIAAIASMNDEQLAKFVPKYGDRVALIDFSKKNNNSKKKKSLLAKLKKKINKESTKNNSNSDDTSSDENEKKKSKPHFLKEKRVIEIGWIHKEKEKFIQVRLKQGGGTRKLSIPRDSKKDYILEEAKLIFFPDGDSPKGKLTDFIFDLKDFKEVTLPDELTVSDLYQKTGLKTLRLYLATEKSLLNEDNEATVSVNIDLPVNILSQPESRNIDEIHQTTPINFIETNADNSTDWLSFLNLPEQNSLEYIQVNLSLHRGQVMNELINAFIDLDKCCGILHIKLILPNGEEERAQDGGGVLRDALTEFWETFYETCTFGTKCKIPFLRHDFGYEQWKAVAKILYKGWQDEKYFPIKLSVAFLEHCFYEDIFSDLIDEFMNYLSQSESDILKQAISNFGNVDKSELDDVLQTSDCKWNVTGENIKKVVAAIAHKELIQKPMFIIDCWSSELKNLLSRDQLIEILKLKQPTANNILKLFNISSDRLLTSEMTQTYGYLKKYIREADSKYLTSFLRFCTGADIVTTSKIDIDFLSNDGFLRSPVAHTCTCLLQLPYTYKNFLEFRSELNSLLSSNIWIMDIV